MPLLLIVALILAWPTFGLSLVAWVALVALNAKKNQESIVRREEAKTVIEPLFREQFAEFFLALDLPTKFRQKLTDGEAHQCGRHLMNFIAHNPNETRSFMAALTQQANRNSSNSLDPVAAAKDTGLDLLCYRAVLALMTNNPNLGCFSKIDCGKVLEEASKIESSLKLQSTDAAWVHVLREWLFHKTPLEYKSSSTTRTRPRARATDIPAEAIQGLETLVLGSAVYPEFYSPAVTYLPREIGNLAQLRELHLQNNGLTELPAEIGDLRNLQDLKLGGNKLKSLPASIGKLKKLEILTAWNNELETLPPEIGQLKNLKGLSILLNPIAELPEEITSLTRLERLELSGTPNLRFSENQKRWIAELRRNGCEVDFSEDDPSLVRQDQSGMGPDDDVPF